MKLSMGKKVVLMSGLFLHGGCTAATEYGGSQLLADARSLSVKYCYPQCQKTIFPHLEMRGCGIKETKGTKCEPFNPYTDSLELKSSNAVSNSETDKKFFLCKNNPRDIRILDIIR